METKTLTAADLRERMQRAGVTQTELARVSGIERPNLSQLLSGRGYLGPVRRARLAAAVVQLGLDKEPEQPAITFRLTQL